MHSEAKELFWKTFAEESSGLFDTLSEDEKATYRLADNTEEIPEAFYVKVNNCANTFFFSFFFSPQVLRIFLGCE